MIPYYLTQPAAPQPEPIEGPHNDGDAAPEPGYLRKTYTSSSAHYSHYGNERIRNSFSAASCWSVKSIPAKLNAKSIQDARQERLTDVRVSKPPRKGRQQSRFFTPLRYGHTDYDAFQVQATRDAELRDLNLISFSRKPFLLTSAKAKLQHEDIVDNENFVYPTLGPNDEKLRYRGRAAEIDKSKPSYGLFRPGGRASKEQQVKEEGRRFVPHWSKQMFQKLSEDWPQLRFKLKFTTSDEFVFSFEAPTMSRDEETSALPDSPSKSSNALKVLDALNRYMKHFATHGLASEFRLIKRGDRWNCLERGHAPAPQTSSTKGRENPSKHMDILLPDELGQGDSRKKECAAATPGTRERRLRFDIDIEDSEENVTTNLSPVPTAGGTVKGEEAVFNDTNASEMERQEVPSVIVYSFFAPWVCSAGVKTRKMESLRSRALARTASLNMVPTGILAPIKVGINDYTRGKGKYIEPVSGGDIAAGETANDSRFP